MLAGRQAARLEVGSSAVRRGSIAATTITLALALGACGPTGEDGAAGPAGQPSAGTRSSATTSSSPSSTSPPSLPTPTPTPTATPSSTSAPTSSPTATATGTAGPGTSPTTSAAPVTAKTILRPGMGGPYVLAAQKRLSTLGYWLGSADGEYGSNTSQAVMALQKAAGLGRDGVLGPKTKRALEQGVRPHPRTTSGSAVEVDKDRQLVMVVVDGSLKYVLNTSTGSGQPYTSDGHDYVATTPEGRFSVQRQIDGLRVSRLGELWRPKYFTGGYALHGSASVPGYPASHGCVRLSNSAIDFLWSSGTAPIGRTVWVY
ncbi:L,D-transpeptidase family protein [Angustibacter sp. McL0619]|uniref:L,D-transpeptidase family protein n=1 Tax=Angustibacter sp. McL0619 TaxID=3415676 RepID=UPI003CEC3537